MECAKDIILELKEGKTVTKGKQLNKGVVHKMLDKMSRHKIMTTIRLATISFMVLDILLISSFVSVLTI